MDKFEELELGAAYKLKTIALNANIIKIEGKETIEYEGKNYVINGGEK